MLNYFQVSFRFNPQNADQADSAIENLLENLNLDFRHAVYFEEAAVKYIRTKLEKLPLKELLEKNMPSNLTLGFIKTENALNSPKRAMYQNLEDYFEDRKLENNW